MQRGTALAEGETYHVYNRGAHKECVFREKADYARFLALLYIANTPQVIHLATLLKSKKYQGRSLKIADVFEFENVEDNLVDVLAYSLMPNHFHLVLRQKTEYGVEKFMRKLCTAYSMYFNMKYNHSGVVFQGRYQTSHVCNEAYFRYIFAYVHLNPVELVQADWKGVGIIDKKKIRSFISKYKYSSFTDYAIGKRPESAILAKTDIPDHLKQQNDLEELLAISKDRP